MTGNIKRAGRFLTSGFLMAGMLTCAHTAQMELHGHSYMDYIQANGNSYLGADGKGTRTNNFLGLEGTVDTNDKSKFWAQMRSVNASVSPSSSFTKAF